MIINPINGQKYPVTSNIGRQVLKKYLNTYKYGGSDSDSSIPEIIDDSNNGSDLSDSSEEMDFLTSHEIRTGFISIRSVLAACRVLGISTSRANRINNVLDSLERHITNVRSMYERSEAENIRILAAINSALEEKDDEIRELKFLLQACSPAPGAG